MSRLHEQVAQSLTEEIVSGELPEGEWLPREVDLAERFGVSRGVAREVIHALRLRGVIDVRHGRGAWVRPAEEWDLLDGDVLRAAVLAPAQRRLLEEVLECRDVFEAQAAELAAERAGPDDAEALATALADLRDALTVRRTGGAAEQARIAAEVVFHDRLVAGADNRPLRRMLEPVHLSLATARYVLVPGELEATLRQHRRIAKAIHEHDGPAARTALRAHVRELGRWLARVSLDAA